MGGRALATKGLETRRYEDKEYKELCKIVLNKLYLIFPSHRFHIVQAYRTKPDHGDMDVVMCCKHNDNFNDFIEIIKKEFEPRAFLKNDHVFSFDYEDFQIDIIFSNEDYFDYQCSGMDYDPTLNIMGKSFYRQMTSFKHKGLYFIYRNHSGRISKEVLLTRDMRKTFEFGGFDYDRYLKGFDTLEEIFDYVINSENFNFEHVKFENLSQKNRKRNRKRPTFHKFIEYCNEKINAGYDIKKDRSDLYNDKNIISEFEVAKNRDKCLEKIDKFFPDVKIYDRIKKLDEKFKITQECAEKFNGKLIMSMYPDLKGKELGNFITYIKQELGVNTSADSLVEVIHPMTQDEINQMIKNKYLIYFNK